MFKRKARPAFSILFSVLLLTLLLTACQGQSETSPSPTAEAGPAAAEPTEVTLQQAQEADAQAEPVEDVPTEVEPTRTEPTVEATVELAEPTPEASAAETAVPTGAPTEAAQPCQWVTNDLTIPMADGLEIAVTMTAPDAGDPLPAVLLLHMLGSNQRAWYESDLLAQLNARGYATMTIDMRGHGATGGSNDWELAETDLQVVWQELRDMPQVDGEATAVIGASIGANMALRLAADEPQIDTAVLLSPGLDYRGVTTEDALANYGQRPIFYAAAEGDSYAYESVKALQKQAPGAAQLFEMEGSAHGTNMLSAEPLLVETIISWLDEHVVNGDR